nr:hypothetical protein [Candidatus Hydrogenosomobacter endosymbioticus]
MSEFGSMLDSGKIPHAWLFVGDDGIGKRTLCFQIARMALCEEYRKFFKNINKETESGMRSDISKAQMEKFTLNRAISQISSLCHPDLFFLSAEQESVIVDSVRRIIDALNKTAFYGGYRVVIICKAQMLSNHSANNLLKILEEPFANTLFLITADKSSAVIPTIMSRCCLKTLNGISDIGVFQSVFKSLCKKEILRDCDQYMQDMATHASSKLFEYTSGRIGAALRMLESGEFDRMRDSITAIDNIVLGSYSFADIEVLVENVFLLESAIMIWWRNKFDLNQIFTGMRPTVVLSWYQTFSRVKRAIAVLNSCHLDGRSVGYFVAGSLIEFRLLIKS